MADVARIQRCLAVHRKLVQLPIQRRIVITLGNISQRIVRLRDEFAVRLHLFIGTIEVFGLIVIPQRHIVARHAKQRLAGHLFAMKHQLQFQMAALVKPHAGIGIG